MREQRLKERADHWHCRLGDGIDRIHREMKRGVNDEQRVMSHTLKGISLGEVPGLVAGSHRQVLVFLCSQECNADALKAR